MDRACLARCHARLHSSNSPLVSAVSTKLDPVVLSAYGHRFVTLELSRLLLLVLRLDKSFSWLLNPVLRHCVQYVPSCLTVFAALASAQLIIILLIMAGFPQYLRHHCRRFGLSTGNIPLAISACSGYRVSFRLLFSELLSAAGFC